MATIQINGVTITGNSIQFENGKIIVDGKDVTKDYDMEDSVKYENGKTKINDNISIGGINASDK
jgi:hypothetical protein